MTTKNIGNLQRNSAKNLKNFQKLELTTFNSIRKVLPNHLITDACQEIGYNYRQKLMTPIVIVLHMILAAIWPEDSFNVSWQVLWNSSVSKFPDLAGHCPSRNKVAEARKRLPRKLWDNLFSKISEQSQKLSEKYVSWKKPHCSG